MGSVYVGCLYILLC